MQPVKNMYVLFGGAGFIGTNIFNRLVNDDTYFLIIDRECKPKFIDNLPTELREHINFWHQHLDFTDSGGFKYVDEEIFSFIKDTRYKADEHDKFDWTITFIHLASTVGVTNNISGNFGAEMRITQNIIQIIKNILDKRTMNLFIRINICYTSTSELFGENSHKLTDNSPDVYQEDLIDLTCLYSPKFAERSEYIYQKFLGEKLFRNLWSYFNKHNNVRVFVLRLFNIVGPFQDTDKGVFSKFVMDIVRGKPSVCSTSIRRYVPIEVVTDFFNPYSKALFGVVENGFTTVMFTGHEKLLSGSGEYLYIHIKEFLKRKYPNCKGAKKAMYQLDDGTNKNGIIQPKEILQRFEPNQISDLEFEFYYGPIIEAIIHMQIKYGPLSKSTLGIEEQSENGQEVDTDEFPGVVTHYKDGIALIEPLPNFDSGDMVLFENNEKGLMIHSESNTCVILGKGDNIKIGLRCKLNGKLQIPKGWHNA